MPFSVWEFVHGDAKAWWRYLYYWVLRGEIRFFAVFLLLTLRSCWTKLICRWFKTPWRSCYVIVLYMWGKPKKSKTLVHLLPSRIYFVFIIQISLQFFLSYCFIHVNVWLWDRVICPLRGIYVHHRLGCGTSLHSGWISSQQGYHTLITKILGPTSMASREGHKQPSLTRCNL